MRRRLLQTAFAFAPGNPSVAIGVHTRQDRLGHGGDLFGERRCGRHVGRAGHCRGFLGNALGPGRHVLTAGPDMSRVGLDRVRRVVRSAGHPDVPSAAGCGGDEPVPLARAPLGRRRVDGVHDVDDVPLDPGQVLGSGGEPGVLGGDLGLGLGGGEQAHVVRRAVEHVADVADVAVGGALGGSGVRRRAREDGGRQRRRDQKSRVRHDRSPSKWQSVSGVQITRLR